MWRCRDASRAGVACFFYRLCRSGLPHPRPFTLCQSLRVRVLHGTHAGLAPANKPAPEPARMGSGLHGHRGRGCGCELCALFLQACWAVIASLLFWRHGGGASAPTRKGGECVIQAAVLRVGRAPGVSRLPRWSTCCTSSENSFGQPRHAWLRCHGAVAMVDV